MRHKVIQVRANEYLILLFNMLHGHPALNRSDQVACCVREGCQAPRLVLEGRGLILVDCRRVGQIENADSPVCTPDHRQWIPVSPQDL